MYQRDKTQNRRLYSYRSVRLHLAVCVVLVTVPYKADCLGKGAKLGTKINILCVKVVEGDIEKVILSFLSTRSKMGITLKMEHQSRSEQLRTSQTGEHLE